MIDRRRIDLADATLLRRFRRLARPVEGDPRRPAAIEAFGRARRRPLTLARTPRVSGRRDLDGD